MARFVKKSPVQISLAALAIYALTLSHGVTLSSLPLTATLAGWNDTPMIQQPLLWLLTLPLRCLPAGWIAPALNLFAATMAALVLGILARSLKLADPKALLGKSKWRAKLPLLLGCAICGLEFNFWQNATAATGEMLQLLLFAAATWCLLEYRIHFDFRWMQAAVFIWGLGLAENWAMALMLPAFVLLLFWFGGLRILSVETILLLALTGLSGFLILLVLPLANGLMPHSPYSLGEAFWVTAKNFKSTFGNLRFQFWNAHPLTLLVSVIFFLIVTLPVIVRRRKLARHRRPVEKILYRTPMIVWLLACVWLAFDPAFHPRRIVAQQTGLALPFLTLDYLAGLCAGYVTSRLMQALRHRNFLGKFPRAASVPGFTTLLILAAIGLLFRNVSAILMENRQPLTQAGEFALQYLPTGGGIVLSDDPVQLMSFQAAAASQKNDRWIAMNTRRLSQPEYREQLLQKLPGGSPVKAGLRKLTPPETAAFVGQLAQSNRIYLLQDSCGFLFETFYLEPDGPVFAIKSIVGDAMVPPPLSDATIAATEQFWDNATPRLEEIEKTIAPRNASFNETIRRIFSWTKIQPPSSSQSRFLAGEYSVGLDDWGVRLQRANRLAAAKKRFLQALKLNAGNVAAKINLECNSNLAAGVKLNFASNAGRLNTLKDQPGDFRRLNDFITRFGMVDDPAFCCLLGSAFMKLDLPRQAFQQFNRAVFLAPDVLNPKLTLVNLDIRLGFAEKARQIIAEIRKDISSLPQKSSVETQLSLLEAKSWLSQTNTANANEVLQSLLRQHPGDAHVKNQVLQTYMSFGDESNALQLVHYWLAANPRDVDALLREAAIYKRFGAITNAIAIFNTALNLTNTPEIRLLRANARVEAGQLDAAEHDFLDLDKTATNHLAVYYGMAEIAVRRRDPDNAILWLERCLPDVPARSPQRQWIINRLKTLKSSKKTGNEWQSIISKLP